ncbi:MAG: hypothetical protein GXO24_02045 [Chlorobi bacterium]|nr:hypothetical protein [Chlorobiota bacterium]
MNEHRFWALVVFVSGLLMAGWNFYLLLSVHAGTADKVFRLLITGVILLITWVAYMQSKRK